MKNGILFKGSELGLVLAVLSFVVSYICFYLWSKKLKLIGILKIQKKQF